MLPANSAALAATLPLTARKFVAPSPLEGTAAAPKSGIDLYARFAFAGAVCCGVTHGALTPVDVVKTRIQLEPTVYNKGMLGELLFRDTFSAD
ncbi:MAG: hypothetical protein BJ554DRAFT_8173 [Olpidium bornovanus]|uniref:Uncharacterized protein n=1 Tax=Olpidium bornovanus TaxID=278681 RepID=A0A8H7ZV04_9FUNG|nr:MAG: hypothetical protein BJ554DRAFT_8173 [Olpidium bornovanus]